MFDAFQTLEKKSLLKIHLLALLGLSTEFCALSKQMDFSAIGRNWLQTYNLSNSISWGRSLIVYRSISLMLILLIPELNLFTCSVYIKISQTLFLRPSW